MDVGVDAVLVHKDCTSVVAFGGKPCLHLTVEASSDGLKLVHRDTLSGIRDGPTMSDGSLGSQGLRANLPSVSYTHLTLPTICSV